FSRRISNHCADCAAFASADRYIVVKRKRYPKTIETRPEVRSAGWDADRDLLHSPSLSCAPNAARQAMTRDYLERQRENDLDRAPIDARFRSGGNGRLSSLDDRGWLGRTIGT